MVESHAQFERRLTMLNQKRERLARGYRARVGENGLIVLQPRPVRRRVPLKPVVLAALGFFAFKGFMLASMGAVTYQDRVATLSEGTVLERLGANMFFTLL